MAKSKKTIKDDTVKKPDVTESNSEKITMDDRPAEPKSSDTEPSIRILFQGSCPKLSARGVGDLEYELGIDNIEDESFVRITGNASSGAYNSKWISLHEIKNVLDNIKKESFRAVVLQGLYANQSSNNHGYLAAILKAEGVLESLPNQPTSIKIEGWETIIKKIDSLKRTDISLTDRIAITAKKKAEKKNVKSVTREPEGNSAV